MTCSSFHVNNTTRNGVIINRILEYIYAEEEKKGSVVTAYFMPPRQILLVIARAANRFIRNTNFVDFVDNNFAESPNYFVIITNKLLHYEMCILEINRFALTAHSREIFQHTKQAPLQ